MSDNNQIQAKWSRRKPFSRLIQVIDAQVAKTRETFQCGYCGRHSLTILISRSFKLSLVIPLTVYHTECGRICFWWTNNVWLLFFSLFSFLFLLILYWLNSTKIERSPRVRLKNKWKKKQWFEWRFLCK